jgi:hypothetical protein
MLILEKTAVFPKRDINIQFQKTPLETEAIQESIGLLQCIKILSDYVVTEMATGVKGLNSKLPSEEDMVSLAIGAPSEGLKKLSKPLTIELLE